MKKILVTRACYDRATSYSFYYAGIIIKEAEEKGIIVLDLKRPSLTTKNFTSIIKNKNPSFVFFNAHGSEKIICGDKLEGREETLVEEGRNQYLLDLRLVYARACRAAASLGRACKGGCFIGYTDSFSFYADENWSAKPSNDNTARLFFEPSNLIVSSLLKGNTAEEAASKSLNASKKTMLKLLKEKAEPGAMASVRLLWNNAQGLALLGKKEMIFE